MKTGVINSRPDIEEMKETKQQALEKERRKTSREARRKVEKQLNDDIDEEVMSGNDESDAAGLYCNDFFSRSRHKEFWLRCENCNS